MVKILAGTFFFVETNKAGTFLFFFFFLETNKLFLFFETGDAKELEEPKLLEKEVGGVSLPDFKS